MVFVGNSTDVFSTLCTLDLGVALWRVAKTDDREVDERTLVLLEVDQAASLEDRVATVSASTERGPTVVVQRGLTDADALSYLFTGAFGAIDPSAGLDVLRRQLFGAVSGEPLFGRAVVGRFLRTRRSVRFSNEFALTPRQREVLELVSRGSSDRDIAVALGISLGTAQKHVAHVLRRLGVSNRAAAVARVLRAPTIA